MGRLRQSARGQACQIRIPGTCNYDPETTVLAHIRRAGIAGIGLKPPDVCGVMACSSCHDVIDGRAKPQDGISDQMIMQMVFDGHLRTLDWWVRHDYLPPR